MEEKKNIIRDILIKEKILSIQKRYHTIEYESRRIKQIKSFKEKEESMVELLNKPLNILKQSQWRVMKMSHEGRKRLGCPQGRRS